MEKGKGEDSQSKIFFPCRKVTLVLVKEPPVVRGTTSP